ncbi:MAG: hypothetical protein WBX26_10755 [Candidatus Cybelea sp.]
MTRRTLQSAMMLGAGLALAMWPRSASAETTQEHIVRLHGEVTSLADQVFETGTYSAADVAKNLLAIQREAHALSEASARANVEYMQQHAGQANASLETVQLEDDFLDAQIDALWDYMDSNTPAFKGAYDAANQQESTLEQQF